MFKMDSGISYIEQSEEITIYIGLSLKVVVGRELMATNLLKVSNGGGRGSLNSFTRRYQEKGVLLIYLFLLCYIFIGTQRGSWALFLLKG